METQIRLQETKQNNLHLGEQNKLVLALMLLGILWLLSTLALLILVFNNRSLATKKSIYVQTQTGQTLKAEEKDSDYRSTTVIQETVTNWIRLTFEWDVYLGADKLDPGYQISARTSLFCSPKCKLFCFVSCNLICVSIVFFLLEEKFDAHSNARTDSIGGHLQTFFASARNTRIESNSPTCSN